MNNHIKEYINKLFSYVPVAVSIFTLVFFISISSSLQEIKTEYNLQALDIVMDYYRFYFFRTILFVLLVPLYDFILTSDKFNYIWRRVFHGIVINITVGIMFFRIGDSWISILLILLMCTVIYISIWAIILFREKKFINNANEFFKNNSIE